MKRPSTRSLRLYASLAALGLAACGDDTTPSNGSDASVDSGATDADTSVTPDTDVASDTDVALDTGETDALPDVVEPEPFPEEECDDTLRPVIMAHGFLASGDTYGAHLQRFSANGYCRNRLFAYDWNTLGQGGSREGNLDAFIDAVLAETGASQVDLAGHSAGGGLGYDYLSNAERAAKVAHYAHIGSFANEAPAGPEDSPVPTLNLYSSGDFIVDEGADIPGATNVMLTDEDHYGVATSPASFTAIYTHFNDGTAPVTTDIVAEERLQVSGRALTLGENIPSSGAAVEIHAVDSATGFRTEDSLVASFNADENGDWGPFELTPGAHYEFFVTPTGEEAVPIHYYREPFVRSNTLVYLRTLPDPTSLAGILLAGLPFADDAAILV
jgi:pimeloyl-ACP methyl ester carboxylesterase